MHVLLDDFGFPNFFRYLFKSLNFLKTFSGIFLLWFSGRPIFYTEVAKFIKGDFRTSKFFLKAVLAAKKPFI